MSGKDKELHDMAELYENAQKENRAIYLDADDLADLADWYAMHYQYDKANEAVEYGLRIHPGNTALLIEQAYLFVDSRQREKAKEIMERITEETSEAKILKANLLMGEGKEEEAEAILNSIEDKTEIGNLIDASYMYLDLGFPEKALAWLKQGAEQYPQDEAYLAVSGDCYYAMGLLDEAMSAFNQLIDKNPYSAPYWFGLASCYFDLQMFDKVIEACDYALVADEEFAIAYMLRGHAFFQLGNDERAMEDFLQAKERNAISPTFVSTFAGIDNMNRGKWEEAYQDFEDAIQRQENNQLMTIPTLYANAALCLYRMGDKRKAHLYCQKARELAPEEIDSYLIEGRIYLGEDEFEKCFLSWEEALRQAPFAETWNEIATFCIEEGYPAYAKLAYERIKKLDLDYKGINEKLTMIYMLLGDYESARKYNQLCEHPLKPEEMTRLQDMLENGSDEELARIIKELFATLQ